MSLALYFARVRSSEVLDGSARTLARIGGMVKPSRAKARQCHYSLRAPQLRELRVEGWEHLLLHELHASSKRAMYLTLLGAVEQRSRQASALVRLTAEILNRGE